MILPVEAWMDIRRFAPLRATGATWKDIAAEAGCDWRNVVGISFFLHKDQDLDALLTGVAKTVPVPLDNAEVEFVEGFSRPGKLVEIEITARR